MAPEPPPGPPAGPQDLWRPPPWPRLAWSWTDQARRQGGFAASKAAERAYLRQLNSVAGRIRQIAAGAAQPAAKVALLRAYAASIDDWARAAAAGMLAAAARKNDQAWRRQSERIGAGLREHLTAASGGPSLETMIQVNANLIRSLPEGAADRIASLTGEALTTGMRPEEMARRIAAAGDAEAARARTIARTEISKANTALTRQRAQAIGSQGYIWRTSRDGGVRHSHRRMEGRYVPWDEPPTLDGHTAHAGEFVNCRCYPEPVIPRPGGGTGVMPSPLPTEATTAGRPALLSYWERHFAEIVAHEDGRVLPGADAAIADPRKLSAYALADPDKARVFASALGMDAAHADDLRRQILDGVRGAPASRRQTDRHGERFQADVPVTGPNGRAVEVRTAWIYDRQDGRQAEAPRLVSAYIKDAGIKDAKKD